MLKIYDDIMGKTNSSFAYKILKENILRLDLKPGEELREIDLFHSLSMSRTPIREALILLKHDGLIETLPQSGTFVTKIDKDRFEDGRMLRICVEEKMIQLACDNFPEEHLKRLEDISALEHIAESVEALCISGCPKVKDFSVLEKLVNLRHLELTGRNEISSLSFLNQMPQIQTFLFSMNVLDGDLTPCMKIPYVYCERNRKHYNLKNKDLPRTVDEYYGWGYKFELPSEYMLY